MMNMCTTAMDFKKLTLSANFISLNVKGIRDKEKRTNIFRWCKDKYPDVFFLQESFSTPDVEDKWKEMWDGTCYFSHGTAHSKGVVVLINRNLDLTVLTAVYDQYGRYVMLKCVLQGIEIVIINVYFPVRGNDIERIDFLVNFEKDLNAIKSKGNFVIIGGDFNLIRNYELDYNGTATKKLRTNFDEHFDDFLDKHKLIDIWREFNGMKRQFTYRRLTPFMQSRLDYWIISAELQEIVVKCSIVPSIAPDHSAIYLHLYNKPVCDNFAKINTSYWKFNNSLCTDREYVRLMKEEIFKLKEELKSDIKDKRVLWDFIKMKICNFTKKYSRKLAKERKEKIDTLEQIINSLESDLSEKEENDKIKALEDSRKELKKMLRLY